MFTLNKLNQLLETFVENHDQIETYRFEDVGEQSDIVYPFLFAVLQPNQISGTEEKTVVRFYLSDRVRPGKENKIEVLSDTKLMALDLLSYFKQINFGYYLNVNTEVTLNDYQDMDVDGSHGWWFDVTFSTVFEWDLCGLPATLPEYVEPLIRTVTIYNLETDEDIIEIDAPGRYGVYVFSGISGGTPSTTYTNSIVGGTP